MVSKPNDDWDFLYEELKRRVDYQMEAHRRFENQASRLLRIILTAISVTVGVVSVMVSSSNSISLPNKVLEIEHLSSQINNHIGLIGESQATLISLLLTVAVFLLFSIAIEKLFVEVPTHAYRVMNPSTLEPSLEGSDLLNKIPNLHNRDGENRRIFREYRNLIEKNEEILRDARRNWELCYNALRIGVLTFTASIFVFAFSFIYYHAQLASLSLLGLTLWFGFYLKKNYRYRDIRPYFTADWKIELGVVLMVLHFLADFPSFVETLTNGTTEERIFLGILSIGLGLFTWSAHSLEFGKLKRLIVRSLFISLSSLSLFFMFLIGFSDAISGLEGEWLIAVFLWGFGYLPGAMALFLVLCIRIGEKRVILFGEKAKERIEDNFPSYP